MHIEEGNRRETGALPAVYTMHVTKNQLECRSVLTPAAAFLLRTMRMRSRLHAVCVWHPSHGNLQAELCTCLTRPCLLLARFLMVKTSEDRVARMPSEESWGPAQCKAAVDAVEAGVAGQGVRPEQMAWFLRRKGNHAGMPAGGHHQNRLERTATSQKAIDRLFADISGSINLRIVLAFIDPGPSVVPQTGSKKKKSMRLANRAATIPEPSWQTSATTVTSPSLAVGGEPASRQPREVRLDETEHVDESELPLHSQSQSQVQRPAVLANGTGRKRVRPPKSSKKPRSRSRAKTHEKPTTAATGGQDASSSEDEEVLVYQSKTNDTVQKVATKFNCDVQDLIRTNAKRFPGVSKWRVLPWAYALVYISPIVSGLVGNHGAAAQHGTKGKSTIKVTGRSSSLCLKFGVSFTAVNACVHAPTLTAPPAPRPVEFTPKSVLQTGTTLIVSDRRLNNIDILESDVDAGANDVTEGGVDPTGATTSCICQFRHNDDLMINCDKCGKWQHVACFDDIDPKSLPDRYECTECQPR